MPKTYIVTGGYGFIGSNLVNELLARGHTVLCFDKMTYAANSNNIKSNNGGLFFCWGRDIANECWTEVFNWAAGKIDGIFNLAAESHVDNSIKNPFPFVETNIKGTINMLEMARRFGTRILQVSTDEVVGSIAEGAATEDFPLVTNSSYSASKAAAELFCRAYQETHHIDIVITRCGNNFGPNQHEEKFIPKIIKNALNNLSIPVYGVGNNIRQWTYVQNHVEDLILVMEHGVAGKTYNVGWGEHYTNNDIVKIILNKLNKPESLIQYVEDRKGHDFRYSITNNPLLWELRAAHAMPYIQFEPGIDLTLRQYTT